MPRLPKHHLAFFILLAVFLVLGITLSVTRPFTAGLDEVAHFQFIRFIAAHGRLPMTWPERALAGYKSDLPPLFHLLVGWAGAGIDLDSPPFIKITQENPRLQLVVGLDNILGWRAITTEDPFQGEVLLWYLGRWVAVVSGAIGVGVTYLLIRAFYPAYPWLALGSAAGLAFLSTYIFNSSVISYESMLAAWLACYFVVLFGILRQPTQNWRYLLLGLFLSLAILTKYTPLPVLPLLPLLIIWLAYQHRWSWPATGWRLILLGLGLALPLGSWLLFTEIHFNRVAQLGWTSGLVSPFLTSDGSDETSLRLAGFISGGQIGVAGPQHYSDPFWEWSWRMVSGIGGGGWLTALLLGLGLVAVAGLIRHWLQANTSAPSNQPGKLRLPLGPGLKEFPFRLWLILMVAHLGLFMFLPLVRFLTTGQAVTGMGQHILFPAAAILILLLVQGLAAWLTPARLTLILLLIAGACLWQSTTLAVQSYNPPWPIQTVPLAEPEPLLAAFGQVSLLSYHYQADQQTLNTTWQWRAESLASEDYRLELTLLDAHGQPQVRWLGQPLNGRYPTRSWLPGDRIRDQINLPIAGLSPGVYQVRFRWLGEAGPVTPTTVLDTARMDGQALPGSTQVEGQTLNLGQVALTPGSPVAAETVLLQDRSLGYTLWPGPLSPGNPPLYQENAVILFSTAQLLPDEVHLNLIGPDGQFHAPIDHTGLFYSFVVEPSFPSGDYHLRFEQWADAKLVAQVDTQPLLRIQTQARQFQLGPILHPLQANFAGQVALLGYDLPQRRVQPGDNLPVTLHWQALKTMGADLIMFNHLVDSDQKTWGGRDRLAREIYSTMLWAPGEIVSDPFEVQVAPDAPHGIYNLLVGLYLPVGQAPVSLPLMQNGRMTDMTNVSLGLVKVGRTPPGFTLKTAHPQNSLNQPFGDPHALTLLGYDLNPLSIDNCQLSIDNCQLSLTLYWRSESPLPFDYTTFVHVRNAAGEIIAQKDQPPLNGEYPTSLWDPGEIIADTVYVPLPANPLAEVYQIVVGLYDFQTSQRLTVPGHPANEVSLRDVQIP